jgi:uncharacterized protein (DUF2252 family)
VKRLAASFVIAGRSNRFSGRQSRAAATAAVASYREHMAEYAGMPTLQAWYASVDGILENVKTRDMQRFYRRMIHKEEKRDATHEFADMTHKSKGEPRIKDRLPLVFHVGRDEDPDFWTIMKHTLERYRASLPDDRRVLFDRYRFHDVAVKVVGVGSVGTLCGVGLFLAGEDDPLFLQFKEARASVLEPFAGKTVYDNNGERVVVGQRLMQAASDIFLGWTHGDRGRQFYVRQLRDLKIKPVIEVMQPPHLAHYAKLCGWVLARAHARSGDAAALSGYMGKADVFDEAIADFAEAYADQNERDYKALAEAVRAGRIEVRSDA